MALIPPQYLDCVVALGVGEADGEKNWVASGFFYGRRVDVDDSAQSEERKYAIYLVTNRHVVLGEQRLWLRANPQAEDAASKEYLVELLDPDDRPYFVGHPDDEIDVVVIPVNGRQLVDEGMAISFFQNDDTVFSKAQLQEAGASEGDPVFVLGFPMGMVGQHRSAVIVRSGSIARLRDCLVGTESTFLVDAPVFPGNSGGPVVNRPELASITGTKPPIGRSGLLGIVTGYLTYPDVAVSEQTRKARVLFEENSGLALVHPVDFIDQAVEVHAAGRRFVVETATEATVSEVSDAGELP